MDRVYEAIRGLPPRDANLLMLSWWACWITLLTPGQAENVRIARNILEGSC